MNRSSSQDEPIGYGSPPKATQFKIGNREHLKRRKRNKSEMANIAREFVEATVSYRDGRILKRGRRIDVHLKKVEAAALKGDLSAIATLLDMHENAGQFAYLEKILIVGYEMDVFV